MSNFVTKWVLEMTDRVSGTAKKVMDNMAGASDAFKRIGESASDSMEDIKEALDTEKKDLKNYEKQVKDTEKKLKELEKAKSKAAAGSNEWKKAVDGIRRAEKQLDGYKHAVNETEAEITRLEAAHEKMGSNQDRWTKAFTGANQAMETVQKFTSYLDFGPEFAKLQNNVQRFTGLTGDALDDLTQKAYTLSEVYGDDAEELLKSANATAKAFNIPFEEAFDLMEQGYEKGANLNGDMLEQMREFAPQMKAAGLSASEMVAMMAKAGNEGVFNDKALDSIKEANLSLREMGQAQVDALHGIGIKVKDLTGKTTFEAVQEISKKMKGASTQARQAIVADIFRGAGEDAGLDFIEGLNSVDLDINKIESVKTAGSTTKKWLADMKGWFATTFSSIAANAPMIGGATQAIAGMLPIMSALKNSTALATAAQWAMNIAGYANPYVAIAVAALALVGALVYLTANYDEVNERVRNFWKESNTVTKVIVVIMALANSWILILYGLATAVRFVYDNWDRLTTLIEDVVVSAFRNVMDGIVAMGTALGKFIKGDFGGAVDSGKEAIRKLSGAETVKMAYEGAAKIGRSWSGGVAAGMGRGLSLQEQTTLAMKTANTTIVGTMRKMGEAHGNAYVDAKIAAAEKWAKYMDKMKGTDVYSKKVSDVKTAWDADKAAQAKAAITNGDVLDGKSKLKPSELTAGSGSGKAITMNLTFDQKITAAGGADIRKMADDIIRILNDRMKDSLVQFG